MNRQFLCMSILILSGSIFTSTHASPKQIDQEPAGISALSPNYRADFDLFLSLMEQVDMQKMTMMSVEGEDTASAEQKAQVAKVIENLNVLSQSLNQVKFITPEGKKVQAAFMAYSDNSIYLLKNQKQWENDEKQKEKLIEHSIQLNQSLLKALQNLKNLAGQE